MLPVWRTDSFTPDLDRALHYTLQWGLEGVVLRTLGGPADRVPHVNEARLKRRLEEADLPVVAVDPGLFEGRVEERGAWMNDLLLLDEVVVFCRRIGCSRILVGSLPGETAAAGEALRRAGDRVARRGCTLAVCNDATGRATGRAVAEVLDTADHPAVYACWSPADARAAGESVSDGLDALAGRIGMVVLHDDAEATWMDVLRSLHAANFDGPVCLDLRAAETATDGLRAATALVRAIRAAQR